MPRSGACEPFSEGFAVVVVEFGAEKQRDPTISDLGGQSDVLGSLRPEVDGYLASSWANVRLERLAEASAVGHRYLVVLSVVFEGFVPCDDCADDVDVFTCPLQRLVVVLSIPALDNLGAAGSQTKDEPPFRQVIHGHCGHRDRC